MDHSYSAKREKHLWKDHSYFSVGKKTPKVITQKAQLLKEQQTGQQGSGWQDHTYTRFYPKLISAADKENSSVPVFLPGSAFQNFDAEGNLLNFSIREGSVGEGIIGVGATETIGVRLEPDCGVSLEPPRPTLRRPDHTYDLQKVKPSQPSRAPVHKPPGQSRSDHSYFGKVTNEAQAHKQSDSRTSDATIVYKCDFFKVKDHSYMGRGGMVIKEEQE